MPTVVNVEVRRAVEDDLDAHPVGRSPHLAADLRADRRRRLRGDGPGQVVERRVDAAGDPRRPDDCGRDRRRRRRGRQRRASRRTPRAVEALRPARVTSAAGSGPGCSRRSSRAPAASTRRSGWRYIDGNVSAARFYARKGFVEMDREPGRVGCRTPSGCRDRWPRHEREPTTEAAERQLDAARTRTTLSRVRDVEQSILARAPETDIDPSLDSIARGHGAARRPAALLPRHPPHRDQRQDVDDPDDRLPADASWV